MDLNFSRILLCCSLETRLVTKPNHKLTVIKIKESKENSCKMSEERLDSHVSEAAEAMQSLKVDTCDSNEEPIKKSDKKIDILLKPTGNAPIMKQKKWAVDSDKPIKWIIDFIKKYLKLDPNEKLFLYVNQTFAPSPDQIVKNLFDCYSTEGKLVLYYCKTQAWG